MNNDKFIHSLLVAREEDILDLIQNLCDVVRFINRPDNAPNKDFWIDYLQMSESKYKRIFDQNIYDFLAVKRTLGRL